MRDCRYETLLKGLETESAGGRRLRDGEGRDRAGLRRVGTDREALPEAAKGDRRRGGQAKARPVPGPPARKGRMLEEALPGQVSRNPDLTLEEHRELFEDEHGVVVSVSSVSRAFGRLGLPLKKSLSRPQSATKLKGHAGTKR